MITAYVLDKLSLQPYTITSTNRQLLQQATWIDILDPTPEEEKLVEAASGLNVPTREEMREIEISSRLYKENNALFMTASILVNSGSLEPKIDVITFILTPSQLITLRYLKPQAFTNFIANMARFEVGLHPAVDVLFGLLEAFIDRLADILEQVGHSLDNYSQIIFRPNPQKNSKKKINFQKILQDIGADGDISAKARESLLTFNRLLSYLPQSQETRFEELQAQLLILNKDILALSDHTNFLSNQVSFLLNGALGMINIEQSNIIRIFTIAAVIFLPPTLVASIYGMNFQYMPELHWHLGYPLALAIMVLSGWIPYKYFKKRRWL
jgi:magnesium transporter